MAYKELEVGELTEIDSVSSFISAVKALKESDDGTSTELYFRGQDAEFWDIEPSIFRNNMLSIEHRLMQIPLQKIPAEFKEFHTTFDIMTKYQHYGMCTRLLDLTTNPLVALYFACKCHGEESYIDDDGEEKHEPYGVIYYTRNYYPSLPTDLEVQIVSALANYDLSKENTVANVLARLKRDHIIDEETRKKWSTQNGFQEFAKIVQENYMVTPTYTNERLRKQSGVFLLASLFSVSGVADIAKSVISKSRGDLRNAFEKEFFFIRGENKEEILKELDLYNINEATLFPELEHQLSYIKYINSGNVQAVADFEKYDTHAKADSTPQNLDDESLNTYILSNLSNLLSGIAKPEEIEDLKGIIQSNFAVDWYKRDAIISKLRMSISGYYFVKLKDKKEAKEKAVQITTCLRQAVNDYTATNIKGGGVNMPGYNTEADYENAIIELFKNDLGYEYVYGPDVERDFKSPLYDSVLEESLYRLNKGLPADAINDALFKLRNFENGELVQKNAEFMEYLQSGIPVRYLEKGEERSGIVYLADYSHPENNSFIVANQWTFIENSNKRPDVILFLNGLPIVLVELKSPSREETDASEAYRQLRNYMQEIPSMFIYNAICVMSDQSTSKAGTITSGEDRFMEWKTKDGSYENTQYAQFDTFFEGLFQKDRLLDIIKNFICFSNEGIKSLKILAGYHQYFAVRKAIESTKHATVTDGKGGVFWHTQGSGKSLSMVFYAHLLQYALDSPTIVVLTDRNDLDDQLYSQFAKCKKFLRQEPIHAESREHLKLLLAGRQANGIIFTTMQKFEESHEPLSERRNIVVMADEAHRGQYGLAEKIKITTNEDGEEVAKRVVGTARIIRNSLPNATYIGFTGTPISSKDRSTREVFGDYIDIYDMTQAVEDGATRPVYYESRVIKLHLDEATLRLIDAEYDIMANNADPQVIEQSKKQLGQMEAVLGNDQTINSLVCDILDHYENNRANLLTGKAMIVAYSRAIAMKIYNRILDLRPAWVEKVAVVMTESNKDPEEWRKIIGNKHHKDELAQKFKDNDSPLKIAIVVDMWLTGFDVPSLATMYVYKPMQGYNLMQAIARVNRVFRDKEGGLVVDYVGIASALKQAMNDYTVRDKKNYGDTDVAKVAYPKFLEKLSICQDLFHHYDYSKFMSGTDLERAKTISGAVNFIMGRELEEERDTFLKEALMLHQALSLCSSLVDEPMRFEAAFFESVRVLVIRLTNQGGGQKISLPEMNARINELLKQSIKSDGVINLFSDVNSEFSLFDPKFLEEISKMKEKNLAVELLKKLIAEQVQIYRRTNVVKSEKFSEIMQRAMNAYLNGMLTNEQVIDEMMKLAKQIAAAHNEGKELGLTADELAFYDALTKPQAIKDFYENDELIAITKELAETLRKNRTIDWNRREQARARMRMLIKRLLKKHKYPPEGMDDAVQTVMMQCELWTDNMEM